MARAFMSRNALKTRFESRFNLYVKKLSLSLLNNQSNNIELRLLICGEWKGRSSLFFHIVQGLIQDFQVVVNDTFGP